MAQTTHHTMEGTPGAGLDAMLRRLRAQRDAAAAAGEAVEALDAEIARLALALEAMDRR